MTWRTVLAALTVVAAGCGPSRSKEHPARSEDSSGRGGMVAARSNATEDGGPPDAGPEVLDAAGPDSYYSATSAELTLVMLGGDEPVALVERDGAILAVTPTGRVVETLATQPTSEVTLVSDDLISFRRGPELHLIYLLEPTLLDVTVATGMPPATPWGFSSSVPADDLSAFGVILVYGPDPSLAVRTDESSLDGQVSAKTVAALRKAHPVLTPEGVDFLRRYRTLHGTPLPRAVLAAENAHLSQDAHALPLPRSARRLDCRGACGKSYRLPSTWPLQLVVAGTDYDCALLGVYAACVWREPETGRFASLAKPATLGQNASLLPCQVIFDSSFTAYAFGALPRRDSALHNFICNATGCRRLGRFLGWIDYGRRLENLREEGLGDCEGTQP